MQELWSGGGKGILYSLLYEQPGGRDGGRGTKVTGQR